jgi:hypothetical protein
MISSTPPQAPQIGKDQPFREVTRRLFKPSTSTAEASRQSWHFT